MGHPLKVEAPGQKTRAIALQPVAVLGVIGPQPRADPPEGGGHGSSRPDARPRGRPRSLARRAGPYQPPREHQVPLRGTAAPAAARIAQGQSPRRRGPTLRHGGPPPPPDARRASAVISALRRGPCAAPRAPRYGHRRSGRRAPVPQPRRAARRRPAARPRSGPVAGRGRRRDDGAPSPRAARRKASASASGAQTGSDRLTVCRSHVTHAAKTGSPDATGAMPPRPAGRPEAHGLNCVVRTPLSMPRGCVWPSRRTGFDSHPPLWQRTASRDTAESCKGGVMPKEEWRRQTRLPHHRKTVL